MSNVYKRLMALIPNPALQVGDVLFFTNGVATVQLPGGGITQARGEVTVGDRVFFRDGLIEGPAPDLPLVFAEL